MEKTQNNDLNRVHIIDFHWEEFSPKMYYFDGDIKEFDFNILDIEVSKEKVCVGKYSNGSLFPCPNRTYVNNFKQCQLCAEDFIKDLKCIFEPKCYGDECETVFCKKPHIVYLAFFNGLTKVGMTSSNRIKQRIIEQGADAFSIIKNTENRKEARELEKIFSKTLRIPQSISNSEILKEYCNKINWKSINYKYGILKKSFKEIFNIEISELNPIEGYPILFPLRSRPRLRKIVGKHKGNVIGFKGKYLIYDSNGLNALQLQEIPGRYITY